MKNDIVLFQDDFSEFEIGPLPFDREHSAMGEYHYVKQPGYSGAWYDPITNCNYRGPNWIVTADGGKHFMEQMRVRNPLTRNVLPVLVAGEKDWRDYTLSVRIRPLYTKEETGMLFRYQTSLLFYGFFLSDGKAEVVRFNKKEHEVLRSVDFAFDMDHFYTLSVKAEGSSFTCMIDGKTVIEFSDDMIKTGCIALAGYMPCQYTDVLVTTSNEENERLAKERTAKAKRLAEKRSRYAQPKLWKVIDLGDFGASRQIRFGHLTGTDEMFFVIAQHQKRVFKERYCNISCLTAVSIDTGKILWQKGEPSTLAVNQDTTCDLPFQVYDIDNDGKDEVIVARDFKLMILRGEDGSVVKSMPTPYNDDPADSILGIEFKKHAFDRLNVDAIRIVNVSGKDRPSDILIKDRYARIWVYDSDFNLIWKFTHNNTGHFPYAYDFNGDGKDEVFSCYNMIDSDGKLLWELPIPDDHTDEIVIGRFDPDIDDDLIAIVSGWEGFMIVDKKGNILHRDINGHGQRISVADYCPEKPGLEICTTTYWENQGIIYLYDCKGNEIWHMEPSSNGNIIAPVNWQGDGHELILLNGNLKYGGMIDGEGDQVVMFPDDGHPDMCAEVINLTGDSRDEIILWDAHKMYIYTQDRECEVKDREYVPEKYPLYNFSNYRGEYSFARWKDKEKGAEK